MSIGILTSRQLNVVNNNETPSSPKLTANNSDPANLPKLTVSDESGGMGFEVMEYKIEEL